MTVSGPLPVLPSSCPKAENAAVRGGASVPSDRRGHHQRRES